MSFDTSAPRGACPTLDDPMRVADGWLARFRPVSGLAPSQIAAFADAAEAHGNGLIEVTARGNLQVRGLSEVSAPGFREALAAAGIAAQPAPAIEFSPIAGEDPKAVADPRVLAGKLRAVCEAALAEGLLSPKLSIVLATGGQVLLGGVKADIRLVAGVEGWALELNGTLLGLLEEAAVPGAMATILTALQAIGPRARASDLDPARVGTQLEALAPLTHMNVRPTGVVVGPLSLTTGPGVRVGLPFGQVRARLMKDLARLMDEHGATEARTAPDRTLVLLGFSAGTLRDLAPALATTGFRTRPDAEAARLSICSGAEKGPNGIIQAAELAQALFAVDPDLVDGSFHLHVSTCAKGCPHAGRPGIVLDGNGLRLYRARDPKPLASLDPKAIEASVVSLARRIRDTRQPGETTLSVFGRLGHR